MAGRWRNHPFAVTTWLVALTACPSSDGSTADDSEASTTGTQGPSSGSESSSTTDEVGSTSRAADETTSEGITSTTTDGSTSDIPSTGGSSGSIAMCVDFGEPCTQCELAACPDLYCECYDNADCGLLAQCVLACPTGDPGCAAACSSSYAEGVADTALLADCAMTQCPTECAEWNLPPPLSECERCVYEECGAQMNACFAITGCPDLLTCVIDCAGDIGCEALCSVLYPGAVPAATTVGDCSTAACEVPCSGAAETGG